MPNPLYDALFAPHAENTATFLATDDGTSVTYASFVKRAAQIAHVLVDCGVTPGDRVVAQAPKVVDTIALYAACVQTGAVYLPLNTAYTQAELNYFVQDATPTVIVCDASDEKSVKSLGFSAATVLTLAADGSGSLSLAANGQPGNFQTVERSNNDLAALLYTSGTTGRSKGAMMSHANLLSNAKVLVDHWHIQASDRLIHALPIFHTHGLFVALNTSLLVGSEVLLMQRFDLDTIITEIPRSTLMMGVPTFYTRLLSDVRLTPQLCDSFRLFISGSAPLLAETHTEFEQRTGHRILERYGMTETNMITSNPYTGDRVAGTVGFALPNEEVRIMHSGREVSPGEIGIIEVRGENVFQGYWKMPEKTKEELQDNGFFITGDLAKQDETGRITIVGRAKDLIISGGYNIYPKEIEDVLNDINGVLESAVIGVPHADFGESVVAVIVPEDEKLSDAALKSAVETQLATFKHPRRYIQIDSLPRNSMGKVQKNILREQYGAEA